MSEENKDTIKELTDDELDKVSGGGYYWSVNDCPYGYTKFVDWASGLDSGGSKCEGCPHYYIEREEVIGVGGRKSSFKTAYCKNTSGERKWE